MRINSRMVILLAAALIAAFTAVVVRKKLSQLQGGKPAAEVVMNRVLVAKRDVPTGKFVDANSDLEWVEPTGDMADGEVIRETAFKKNDFNGGVLRRPLRAGKPVAPDEITKAGDGGFLSAVLEPGMRAVSIAVTATTGAAGFIAPGDRVDLIVTHRIKSSGRESEGDDTVISETFVRDVRVVAVDQSLESSDNKALVAKNVTVEVRENQAEQIAVAIEMGKISLSLRSSLQDSNAASGAPRESTNAGDVIPSLSHKTAAAPRVQVIRGDKVEDIQFMDRGH